MMRSMAQVPFSTSQIFGHIYRSIQRIAMSISKLLETNMQNKILTLDFILKRRLHEANCNVQDFRVSGKLNDLKYHFHCVCFF